MLCKIFRHANPVRVLNLLFTSAVIGISAQPAQDATSLQKIAIERVERCGAHLRKSGEVQSIQSELRQAEAELSQSYQEFMKREDWAAAALSLQRMAVLQRWQSEWKPARELYQRAFDLASRANHVGRQVKTLVGLAKVAGLGLKDYGVAKAYLDEAVRMGEQGVDKSDLFDIYDLKSASHSSRGEFTLAFGFASRAMSLALEMNDPETLFYGYFGRGGIYQSLGMNCDNNRGTRSCADYLSRAISDYEEAY